MWAWFAKHRNYRNRLLGGRWHSEEEAAQGLAFLNGQGFDTYYHINSSMHELPRLKGAREDIDKWLAVLVDLDPAEEHGRLSPELASQARSWISEELDIPESTITTVWSGRGLQCLIGVMAGRVGQNAAEIEGRTATMLRWLAGRCSLPAAKVDTTTYDLARIARMPGSVNSRTGELARMLEAGGTKVDGFRLLSPFEPVTVRGPQQVVAVPEVITRAWLLANINVTAERYLFEGSTYPSRHHDAYATARCLAELGVPEETALQCIVAAAERCRPRLEARDAIRQVRCAYSKALSVLQSSGGGGKIEDATVPS